MEDLCMTVLRTGDGSFSGDQSRKEPLKEHVTEIQIPRNGLALLEANQAGLLRCIEMVTPRGVDTEAQLFSMKVAV